LKTVWIGGVRVDELRVTNNAWETTGAVVPGFPVSKAWYPVSYRAAATWEPIEKMVFYGLYGTSYDPASAPIQLVGFDAAQGFPLTLTSSLVKEVGVKHRCGTTGRNGRLPPTISIGAML
jgi:hypothetical protein